MKKIFTIYPTGVGKKQMIWTIFIFIIWALSYFTWLGFILLIFKRKFFFTIEHYDFLFHSYVVYHILL